MKPSSYGISSRQPILLLLAATLLSRLPFTADEPYSWDSYNYHLAVQRYLPAEDMPHFPGYFNYVMPVKALHLFIANPNSALVVWSVIMSLVLVALVFSFARTTLARLLNLERDDAERFAFITALLTAVNPLVWFYGSVALGYINGGLVGVCAVWSILSMKSRLWQWLLPPLLIGWLTGFRLECGALLLLLAYQAWRSKLKWPLWIAGLIAFFIGISLWLIPTLILSGSPTEFWQHGLALLQNSHEGYVSEQGLLSRLARVVIVLLLVTGAALFPLLLRPLRSWNSLRDLPQDFKVMLAWWILPIVLPLSALFLLPGYFLIIVPAMSLLIAAILLRFPIPYRRFSWIAATVVSVIYFVMPAIRDHTLPFSAARIRQNDQRTVEMRTQLRPYVRPNDTVILCYGGAYPWREAMVDFPDLPAYQILGTPGHETATEGWQGREHAVKTNHSGNLLDLPPQISRLIIAPAQDESLFARDFPHSIALDTLHFPTGDVWVANLNRLAPVSTP